MSFTDSLESFAQPYTRLHNRLPGFAHCETFAPHAPVVLGMAFALLVLTADGICHYKAGRVADPHPPYCETERVYKEGA